MHFECTLLVMPCSVQHTFVIIASLESLHSCSFFSDESMAAVLFFVSMYTSQGFEVLLVMLIRPSA